MIKSLTFFSGSEYKISHFKSVFPEDAHTFIRDVNLTENHQLSTEADMVEFKLGGVLKDERFLGLDSIVIEDTIIVMSPEKSLYGRKIGERIKEVGINNTVKELTRYGRVGIKSLVCYYHDKKFYHFSALKYGFFKDDKDRKSNSTLENFFWSESRQKLLGECPVLEFPRCLAFKKLRDFLEENVYAGK